MKTYNKFFVMLFWGVFISSTCYSQNTKQLVKITNLEKVKGTLYVGWYKTPATFRMNEQAIYRKKVSVNNQAEVHVSFKHIPKGKYAIAVFLDENDNYNLDKNFLGVPKEKYGFSNNVIPLIRPASFDESSFQLNQNEMAINIVLK